MSGNSDVPVAPIRTVRPAPSDAGIDTSDPSELLPSVNYPDISSFTMDQIIKTIDVNPLASSLDTAVSDIRGPFTESISSIVAQQSVLVQRMQSLDNQAKHILSSVHTRIKKSEKDAELLAGSERISIIAEKNYNEVERILRLFREIDHLLPAEERIEHHKDHYRRLAPLVLEQETPNPITARTSADKCSEQSKAISSLKSIQEQSPAQSSRSAPQTQDPTDSSIKRPESSLSESVAGQPPRLRLAPRKSKSNLRVPQIRTVPPLPSTQLSTALPTVERDNMSTRSSMASHRSITSTLSFFLRGQPSMRTAQHEGILPSQQRNAEDSLRKISGSSLARGRVVSAASLGSTSARRG